MKAEDMMGMAEEMPRPRKKGKPKRARDRILKPRDDPGGESSFNLMLGLLWQKMAKYVTGPHPDTKLVQVDFRVGEMREICSEIKKWRDG